MISDLIPVKAIDGHVNFYHPLRNYKGSILDLSKKISDSLNRFGIEEFVGNFQGKDYNEAREIVGEGKHIHPGIYIDLSEYSKEDLKNGQGFWKFVKLHHYLMSPTLFPEMIEPIVEDALDAEITKFKIHTEQITSKFLEFIQPYLDQGIKWYLVHGMNTLYFTGSVPPEELAKLDNVFLGSTQHHASQFIPNENVEKAINDGLEDKIIFETDHTIIYSDSWIDSQIRSITESIGYRRSIFYDNVRRFLEHPKLRS